MRRHRGAWNPRTARRAVCGTLLLTLLLSLAVALPGVASGSGAIAEGATGAKLAVSKDGKALVTFQVGGKTRSVLASGAINAIAAAPGKKQVAFKLNRADTTTTMAAAFKNTCGPYKGGPLPWLVTACIAKDGSHWALQSWQRLLPDLGVTATAVQTAPELRLSHWKGEIETLSIKVDWSYRRYHHLYGSLTYLGQPMYGLKVSPQGAPLDDFGRNIYVDTLNSAYGQGWQRENSFLAQRPNGSFCYSFSPHQNGSASLGGMGEVYRATVIGPGVLPDVSWQGASPGAFDPTLDAAANEEQRTLYASSARCRPN